MGVPDKSDETDIVGISGISEPVFYGDLVYKFKRIAGKPNFSDHLKK